MHKLRHSQFSIGVDLGGTKISAGIVDQSGKIISKTKLPTFAQKGPEFVINQIIKSIQQVIKKSKIKHSQILGIGIGAPGPLDTEKGIIHHAPNLPGWNEIPLRNKIQSKIGMDVFIDNDANLAALGESWIGAGKNVKNLICITLGTGVGGGLILDGKIFHGFQDAAGEIGHITVNPSGPKCNCGNYGCLEAYSSATGIVNRIREAIKNGEKSSLKEPITSKKVYEFALKGDKLSKRIMKEAGIYLGIALSTVANLLNLEMAIITGNVANAGDMIFEPARHEIKKRTIYPANKMKIVPAKLKTDAGIIGSARVVFLKKNLYNNM
ncbi:MAG: ROK family protein [Endomicrobiia bacterium]